MVSLSPRFAFLGLALGSALIGCGDRYEAPSTRTHWSDAPARQENDGEHFRGQYPPFVLPEAHNVRLDRPDALPRIVVNLSRNGDVILKGYVWKLATGIAEERREYLSALREQMSDLHTSPEFRGPDGSSRLPFLLHAEREAKWRDMSAILRLLVHEGEPPTRRLQWAVHPPTEGRDVRHEGQASPIGPGGAPPGALDIRLVARDSDDGADDVSLSIGELSWAFGPVDTSFEELAFLERANQTWNAVDAHLPEALAGRTAAARVPRGASDSIPWAYFVKVVDLLMGQDVFEVYVPAIELRLDLERPEDLESEGEAAAQRPGARGQMVVDTEALLERLEDALKSKSAPNVELLVALDAVARAHRRLRLGVEAGEPRRVRRSRERFLKSAEKLYVKALKLDQIDKPTKRNLRDEVNVRAAQILGDTGNPKLARDVRKALESQFFKTKYDVPIQVIEEALNALARLGDPKSLEWMVDELTHTKESEADRLVAAHRAMILFENVEGKLRYAVVSEMVKTYTPLAVMAALAKQDESGSGFDAAQRIWSRLERDVIRVVQVFAGHPNDDAGKPIATMQEFETWYRANKKPRAAPWLDD